MTKELSTLGSVIRTAYEAYAGLRTKNLALNYTGTFDPLTDDSANFITQMNAACSVVDSDNVIRVNIGSGTVNLSGLTTAYTLPAGHDFELHLYDTQVVLGTFIGGTSSHPVNGRIWFVPQRNAQKIDIFFHGSAAVHGANRIIAIDESKIYTSAADWGQHFPRIALHNVRGHRCTGNIFFGNFDTSAGAEDAFRRIDTNTCFVTTEVTGDGTIAAVTISPMPTRSDTGANKILKDTVVRIELKRTEEGFAREFQGTVYSTANLGGGNWQLTFASPIPSGMTVLGPVATTLSGAHGTATGNKLTVASSAGIYKGRSLTVVYDDATTIVAYVYDVPSAGVVILCDPLTKAAASGNAVTDPGASLAKIYPPAVTFDKLFFSISDVGFQLLPTSVTPQRHIYMGNSGNTVVCKDLEIVAANQQGVLDGGRQFGISCDSTTRQSDLWQDLVTIRNITFKNRVSADATSGGTMQLLGFQRADIRGLKEDPATRRSLNQCALTLAEDIVTGQTWVHVTEDTQAVVKFGYSVVALSGEPTTSMIVPTSVSIAQSTTLTSGASIGNTAIAVTSSANFTVGRTVTYPTTVSGVLTTRYNTVASISAGIINLLEALDGTIANGATISRLSSSINPAETRGGTNGPRLRIPTTHPDYGQNRYFNAALIAVDTSRGAGGHRIYLNTNIPGYAAAGTVLQCVDNNWFVSNGDEWCYTKLSHAKIKDITFADLYQTYQGTFAAKGGEEGKTYADATGNNGGNFIEYEDIVGNYSFNLPLDDGPSFQTMFWVQQAGVRIKNCWAFNYPGRFVTLHNGSALSNFELLNSGCREKRNVGGVEILQPSGFSYRVKNYVADWTRDAPLVSSAVIVQHTNTGAPGGTNGPRSDMRDIWLEDIEWHTLRVANEAVALGLSGSNHSRTPCIDIQSSNGVLQTPICIRGVYMDGDMGRTNYGGFLRISNAGRICGLRFGSKLDLSQYKSTKCDLIKIASDSSGVVTTAMLSTVTTAGQSAGDMQVSIADRMSYNLPIGMPIWITLDNAAIHKTWLAIESDRTGVLKIVDPIPTGRSVNNGGVVQFRPVSQIDLDNPKAIGYEYEENVLIASGVSILDWSIAGKFIKYFHSEGLPPLNSFRLETLSGDIRRKDFEWYIDPTDTTHNVANDNTQASGTVRFNFISPTLGTARNMSAATLVRVGFRVPYLRFNA